LRVLALEVQELGDNQVGDVVVDRRSEEDDALLEEQRKNVERALRPRAGFDDCGDHVVDQGMNVLARVHAGSSWSSPLTIAARRSSVLRERRLRRIVATPSS